MLTQRQETVLKLIVDDYTRTATPIGSETVAQARDLGVSSATVRKDLAALDREGYITRAHSSAGSVPLDKAYRFYVESMAAGDTDHLPSSTMRSIRRKLGDVERDVDEWTAAAAAILAQLVGNMAIATFPKAKESRVKHLQLIQLQDVLAMLIIVMEQASLRRQIIRLQVPVEAPELETTANKIKSELQGLTRREIESRDMALTPLEEKVVEAAVLILKEEERETYSDHYVDGLRNLLGQPEFDGNDSLRSIVEAVEDGSLVQAVLQETPDGGVVRVIIGEENQGDQLWPLSIVICQYGIPLEAVGAVGAIGPTRMEYPKTIAGVQFMSSVMSDLVETVHPR
jgi:heat-inducible transcriptional repressor